MCVSCNSHAHAATGESREYQAGGRVRGKPELTTSSAASMARSSTSSLKGAPSWDLTCSKIIGWPLACATKHNPLVALAKEKAGVEPGDKIIKIEDKLVANLKSDESVSMLRGIVGTKVKIEVERKDAKTGKVSVKKYTLKRQTM